MPITSLWGELPLPCQSSRPSCSSIVFSVLLILLLHASSAYTPVTCLRVHSLSLARVSSSNVQHLRSPFSPPKLPTACPPHQLLHPVPCSPGFTSFIPHLQDSHQCPCPRLFKQDSPVRHRLMSRKRPPSLAIAIIHALKPAPVTFDVAHNGILALWRQ